MAKIWTLAYIAVNFKKFYNTCTRGKTNINVKKDMYLYTSKLGEHMTVKHLAKPAEKSSSVTWLNLLNSHQ